LSVSRSASRIPKRNGIRDTKRDAVGGEIAVFFRHYPVIPAIPDENSKGQRSLATAGMDEGRHLWGSWERSHPDLYEDEDA
jgi:hypothetical protein